MYITPVVGRCVDAQAQFIAGAATAATVPTNSVSVTNVQDVVSSARVTTAGTLFTWR